MKSLAILTLTLLALTACNLTPRYERPAVLLARVFPEGDAMANRRHLSQLDTDQFIMEPRLRCLITLALQGSPDLRSAMLRVEQNRAQFRIQRASLLPSVNASTSANLQHFNDVDSASEQWSASLGSTAYEVDLFGRVRSLSRQALEKFFATAEGERSARIALVAQVASQYFLLRQYEEQLELAKQTLTAVQDSYSLNKSTFDAGAITELDLRTSETQVQNAKINSVTYERLIAQATHQLVMLIGQPLPSGLPGARPLASAGILANIRSGLPSELLASRPDILEAEHTLKAANASIGAARAAFFPSIKLTATLDSTSSGLSTLLGSGTGMWTFAPKITVPLFSGGSNRANLDAAKISALIEVANYQKAIQTAFQEVADALTASRTYRAELALRQDLIAAQRKRYELATARYRQGVDTYLNVLSAQQDLYTAEQNLITTRFNVLNSQVSLYKVLGGGWK